MDPQAVERLEETIRQLQRGDVVQPKQEQDFVQQDQSVPWSLAYHVAVQKEAARVSLPSSALPVDKHGNTKRTANHAGPANLFSRRNVTSQPASPGGTGTDPFGRTGPTKDGTSTWRVGVAKTPAYRIAARSESDASTAQWTSPAMQASAKGPTTAAELDLDGAVSDSVTGGAIAHGAAGESAASATGTMQDATGWVGQLNKTASPFFAKSPSYSTAAPLAGQQRVGGPRSAPGLKEVPEAFWQTVAPDVHQEMLEHLYDYNNSGSSYIQTMLAALRAKKSTPSWAVLPIAYGADKIKDKLHASPASLQKSCSNSSFRAPGTLAQSRWYQPDGSSEWWPCTVVQSAADGTSYAIRWQHSGGIKTVTRFNIMFDGETEAELTALKAQAVQHQHNMKQLQLHAKRIDGLPAFDAPSLPPDMAISIIHRVGGAKLTPVDDGYALPAAEGAAAVLQVSQSATAVAAQTDGKQTIFQMYLLLQQMHLKRRLGIVTADPDCDPAMMAARAAQQLEYVLQAGGLNSGEAHVGWRLGLDESWHRFVYPNAELRLRTALEEAAADFSATHNRLAYCAAFQKETGLQVPERLDAMLVNDGVQDNEDTGLLLSAPIAKPSRLRGTVKVVEDPVVAVTVAERAQLAHATAFHLAMSSTDSTSVTTMAADMGVKQSVSADRTASPSGESRPASSLSQAAVDTNFLGPVASQLHHSTTRPWSSKSMGTAGQDSDNGRPSYDRAVYDARLSLVRRKALEADGALLKAWQHSIHYLSDVLKRDIFGLKQLPLKAVFESDRDMARMLRWRRYLESRKPAAEVMVPGSGEPLRVKVMSPHAGAARPACAMNGQAAVDAAGHVAAQGPLTDTVNLITFLNVLEGARVAELHDLRPRVVGQLALIVMDAAQEALTASVDDWEMPVPQPAQLHKYGNFPGLDPMVRAALAARAARGNAPDVRFDQDAYYRLASLLNVALFDTVRAWLVENMQVYTSGIWLYSLPDYTGPPLFEVVLDAIGDEIKFTPSLEVVEARLVETLTAAITGINALPGLKVVQRAGSCMDATSLPFDVQPILEMPTLLSDTDTTVQACISQIKAAVAACQLRCTDLLDQFGQHLGLLGVDARMLKAQLGTSRASMQPEDWRDAISKYRQQCEDIVDNLPVEVCMGLLRVDCVALKRRLSERADRLATTLLLTLQEDAQELSNAINSKLQPVLDVLTQPQEDLGAVYAVKDTAREAPGMVMDLWRHSQQLRMMPDLLHAFKHTVPDELSSAMWNALRLPFLVDEAVAVFTQTVSQQEARFLAKLKLDRQLFAQTIQSLSKEFAEWNSRAQEELVDEYLELANRQMSMLKAMLGEADSINKQHLDDSGTAPALRLGRFAAWQSNASEVPSRTMASMDAPRCTCMQEVLAGWSATSYTTLHLLRRQLLPFLELWKLVKAFKENYNSWMYGPLFAFDMEMCETSVPAWTRLAARLAKDLKGPPQGVASKYSTYLVDFEGQLPLLRALRTQGLRQRHWARIHAEVPALEHLDKSQLTLHMLLQAGMGRHAAVLRELADLAARELVIEQAVSNISTAFMALRIAFIPETESGIPGIHLLSNGIDLIKFIDDAQLRIKGLSTSVYVDPHKESVVQWDEALGSVRSVLEAWLEVQARWGHLAPLFGPQGLSTQLPLEARRFMDVTREWRKTIASARSHCQLSELLRHAELPILLAELSRGLEAVHKGVMEFLEEKRANFPRFYFLSNNEMVNVLVRAHDALAVEPYLSRCFPGISKLALSREWGVRIEGLISPESEQLLLRNPVDLVDYASHKGVDVEVWMLALEKQMRVAMRETLKSAIEALASQPYEQWLLAWPAQAVLLTGALVWCRDVTECFKVAETANRALQRLSGVLGGQVLRLVAMVQGSQLTALQRSVLENVILVKVYQRDVLARLVEGNVTSAEDVEWLRVMRFYQEGKVVVRVGYSQISYGQEYLGNSPRLVITPLTERAFSSLITAVHLHYGGAPEGPAGTGKTETVKELARGVAKQCIVFNTTEQLDISHMTRLLMGIASTGAWSCFDEFNRMDMEVLSVVAKQIMTIQAALSTGERYFMFEGRNLGINSTLAIFITLNPMYEYRNMLPSNLKALFRPVAMMVPDYRLIAEVQLYAAGFQMAGPLAAHLVSVLKISSHRLSGQAHYDFAMRTMKSVLLIAAQLRTAEAGKPLTADEEASLVRVALLRCNMSKLRAADAQIFMNVVEREFPQPGTADQYMGTLKKHVVDAAGSLGLHATEELSMRCLQTYAMLQIRTGVMLLGPAACGKTAVIKTLAAALSTMDAAEKGAPAVSVRFVFPKAVSTNRLYGQYNGSTQTWEDGVLTAALREANSRDAQNRAWVVLDGPVDHVWVEALNPVLDDNRTLCLSSGETIPLRQGLHLIMEVDSIAMASPATVSRCGMVYLGPPNADLWSHRIRAWCTKELPVVLHEYTNKVETTLTLIFNELIKAYSDSQDPDSMAPRQQPSGLLAGMLRLLGSIMGLVASKVSQGAEEKDAHACIECGVLMALVWSFEACLPAKARAFFNILVRQMCARTVKYQLLQGGMLVEHSSSGFQVPIPPEGQVFDYMFDFTRVNWVSWKDYAAFLLDPAHVVDAGSDIFAPFGIPALLGQGSVIPSVRDFIITADNLPALFTVRMLLASRANVMLMGPTGTGKTALVSALLDSADEWMPARDDGDIHDSSLLRLSHTGSVSSEADPTDSRPSSARLYGSDRRASIADGHIPEDPSGRRRNTLTVLPLTLSSQSTASNTRSTIQSYLVKRRQGVIGPPVGKLAVIFVDDLNSAGRDAYGTQGALELLRQWCAMGGWHDEAKARFVNVTDSQLVGCITQTPFQKLVSDRLLQYVSLVGLPPISHSGFTLIFTAVLKRYMRTSTTLAAGLLPALVSATMDLYKQVTATLLPVPSRPHYLFSIRHVGAVFKAMFHAHRGSRATSLQLLWLWQHECCRVFHDRIVDANTRTWFDKVLFKVTESHLGEFAERVPYTEGKHVAFITFATHNTCAYELAEHVLQGDRALTPDGPGSLFASPLVTPRPADTAPASTAQPQPSSDTDPESAASLEQQRGLAVRPSRSRLSSRIKEGECAAAETGSLQSASPPSPDKPQTPSPELARQATNRTPRAGRTRSRGNVSHNKSGTDSQENSLGGVGSSSMVSPRDVTSSLPLPPPPETPLTKLYAQAWVEDGMMTREEAVHARLTEIARIHASNYLQAHTTTQISTTANNTNSSSSEAAPSLQSQLTSGIAPEGGLVVFRSALMHLARITRMLSMEQGHLMLVGPNGSGRRTLARLACHMSKVAVFEANLKDGQKGFIWHDMLKLVMHSAGVTGRPTCLLLVDVGRPAESMLDDISHLMASAYLPGLFNTEETQTIVKSLKPVARAAGIQWSEIDRTGATDAVLQKFFVDRCRANLHVMLVLEQHEASLQRLIVDFPKMFHLATINIIDDWDEDARQQVAKCEFGSPADLCLDPLVFVETISACCEMHEVAKHVASDYWLKAGGRSVCYVTACQYLQLLQHIKKALPQKRSTLKNDREKYLEGVAKMMDMTAKLKTLQDQIAAMQPRLQERQSEAAQLMAMIQEEKAEAEAALAAIMPEEEQARIAAEKKAALVAECEAELSKVMPPLVKALKELRAIDKASIAELKVMKNPPEGVKLVMRAICIMLSIIPDMVAAGKIKDEVLLKKAWWEESIRVLGDLHFLDALLMYDKDEMTPEMTAQVSAFTTDPSFDPAVVARSSQSAAVLAKWVIAMDDYQRVKKVVDPKRDALRLAEEELGQQEARLQQARLRLDHINATIQEQEQRYLQAVAAQDALLADIQVAQRRVSQAQRVLNAVRKEVERWNRNAEASELRHKQVLGEALLSAGYFAYMGPLPGSYRLQAEAQWGMALDKHDIPLAPGFSLAESMGDPAQLDMWRDAGLPQSRTAVENALVMEHSNRWTLLVDPQELGNQFLRGYYGGEHVGGGNGSSGVVAGSGTAHSPLARGQLFITADQSDVNFRDTMLHAIESGSVLLLENLDEDMDDMIEQVLQQNTFHNQRGELCIKLGDASAKYNQRFRMFVTTRLRAPRFPFNVVRYMCVCNFSITKAQLGELLITATLRHEMPELEAEHGTLIKQRAKNATEILSLEEQMLDAINTTSTESLLEESAVYSMLVALQESAASIKTKVQRIEESQKRIADVRASIDKHLVSRVSILFFVLQDMALVRHTYQFSLRWFSRLFSDALMTCPRSNTGRERLDSLTQHFINMLYTGATMSLFDEDKRPFAVLMLARYLQASGVCSKEEASLLLFGRSEQGKPSLARLTEGPASRRSSQQTGLGGSRKLQKPASRQGTSPKAAVAARNSSTSGEDSTSPKDAPQQLGDSNDAFAGMFKGGSSLRPSRLARSTTAELQGSAAAAAGSSSRRSEQRDVIREGDGEGEGDGSSGDDGGSGEDAADALRADIEDRRHAQMMEALAAAKDEEHDVAVNSSSKSLQAPSPKASMSRSGTPTPHQQGLMAPGSVPDFLEMSAPAQLPDEMRPPWLPEDAWARLRDLGKHFPYNKLLPHLFSTPAAAQATCSYHDKLCDEGPDTAVPHARVLELSAFQRLLFVRCLQPRAFLPAAQTAVRHYLGAACTVTEPVELESAFSATQPGTPIVLISTTDQPLPQLMMFAEQRSAKVIHMAIGRGQGLAADKVIRASLAQPVWVVLENTHLAGEWMPQLCSLVQALPSMQPHWEFRLWLTTVPTEEFPAVILQTSLKLVMDPPAGLKANLASVLNTLPAELLAPSRTVKPDTPVALPSFPTAPKRNAPDREVVGQRDAKVFGPLWRQLVLRLCLFHAMLLERRHYRALGWKLPYDFSAADFNAAIKQVIQVHKEVGGVGPAEVELDAIDRALPGLLYVGGQCLYGGKVTHDWDRRLLACLLQQQLMPGSVLPPPKGQPSSVPTADSLLPEKVMTGTMELSAVSKELRQLRTWVDEPGLVGLTDGAAAVRQAEQTRHALHILKRVQMMQGSVDSESDAAKPLTVALSVAQDVARQLPFTVLPTVLSAWALMVLGKSTGLNVALAAPTATALQSNSSKPATGLMTTAAGAAAHAESSGSDAGATGLAASAIAAATVQEQPGEVQCTSSEHAAGAQTPAGTTTTDGKPQEAFISPLAAVMAARAERAAAKAKQQGSKPAASAGSEQAPVRTVNRARQLKMTESMSRAAADRWTNMSDVHRKMMVQVFETEVACYQAVLSQVHSSIKMVTAAIKGFEPVTGAFQELVRQLSSNEVPRAWANAGPGGQPVELATESIAAWVNDLLERLDWLYAWAVDGPPLVWQLGMLARPKAFLTAIQQIHAARLDCAVGSLVWHTHILTAGSELQEIAAAADTHQMEELQLRTSGANSGDSVTLREAVQAGCVISGVLLQGACWDPQAGCLTEANRTTIYSHMPLLWLMPVIETEHHSSVVAASDVHALTTSIVHRVPSPLTGIKPAVSTADDSQASGDSTHGRQAATTVQLAPTQDILPLPQGQLGNRGPTVPASSQPKVVGSGGTLPASRMAAVRRVRTPPTLTGRASMLQPGLVDRQQHGASGGRASIVHAVAAADRQHGAGASFNWEGSGDSGTEWVHQEMYVCPVYMHSHLWHTRMGNRADIDDCLFDMLLPPGVFSAQHWVLRNVALLVCADPSHLVGMQASRG